MDHVARLTTASRMTARVLPVIARTPRDLALALRIAAFVRHLPAELAARDVRSFLAELRARPGVRIRQNLDPLAQAARIRRIATAVLSLPRFWQQNTCYVRALVIYRFLDARGHELTLHLGVEQRGPERALHGHAWLTLDDALLEAPDGVLLANLRSIAVDVRR